MSPRGQQAGRGTNDTRSMVEKARDGWGKDTPDWVAELARVADAEGLRGAGKRIGYSTSAVSTVISGTYKGDTGRIAEKVRGALLGETVDCPGLGDIMTRSTCLDWQAKPHASTSALRVRMHRACRSGCPHFRKGDRS